MFAEHSVIVMLVLAVAGAGLCLLLLRPRQVLATILGVTAAEGMLAANLWAAVLSGRGVVTAAEQWFYIDAFVGVFVMGIAIYHINREFGSVEIDRLSALKG